MTRDYFNVQGEKITSKVGIRVDHCVETFTVTIRSLSGLTAGMVKKQLQERFEVTAIEKTKSDVYGIPN